MKLENVGISSVLMSFDTFAKLPDHPRQANRSQAQVKKEHHKTWSLDKNLVKVVELPDGTQWKLDGHSRVEAVKKGKVDKPTNDLMVIVYEVDSEVEAMEMFEHMDNKVATETTAQVIASAKHVAGVVSKKGSLSSRVGSMALRHLEHGKATALTRSELETLLSGLGGKFAVMDMLNIQKDKDHEKKRKDEPDFIKWNTRFNQSVLWSMLEQMDDLKTENDVVAFCKLWEGYAVDQMFEVLEVQFEVGTKLELYETYKKRFDRELDKLKAVDHDLSETVKEQAQYVLTLISKSEDVNAVMQKESKGGKLSKKESDLIAGFKRVQAVKEAKAA